MRRTDEAEVVLEITLAVAPLITSDHRTRRILRTEKAQLPTDRAPRLILDFALPVERLIDLRQLLFQPLAIRRHDLKLDHVGGRSERLAVKVVESFADARRRHLEPVLAGAVEAKPLVEFFSNDDRLRFPLL